MIELKRTQTVPLTLGEDSTIRVTGSRVTLESILGEFKRGATAEQIQEDFPSLTIREIYGAIAYYLENSESTEEYLHQQKEAGEATRQFIESRQNLADLRKRILERRAKTLK